MQPNRRTFLTWAAAGLTVHRAWAAAPSGRPASGQIPDARFLLVFLRGGYDALSLLVPSQSSFYREVRPNTAIALSGNDSAQPLDANWSLHPAVEVNLRPIWQQKQLAFVPFAGTADTSRSHFETQDSIELGQPLDGKRDFNSGFMNRLAGQLMAGSNAKLEAMSFTDQLPVSFRGATSVANMGLKGKAGKDFNPQMQSALAGMYAHHELGSKVNEGFETRNQIMKDYAQEMDAASRSAINASGFEAQARRMAKLMRERYALGFIDVGGWDTHVNQGAGSGYLAKQLADLSQGLSGFASEMGADAWRQTTVVVISEFGRTLRENGNRGTDHGHGSVYWVMGGSIQGGRIAGEQQTIEARTIFQNRDLPVLNDYRGLLGGLLQKQFGLSAKAMDTVFPGGRPLDLGLI